MASLIPTFDQVAIGSGVTATKDDWFDLSSYGVTVPNGKQLWLGYLTLIAEDKQLIFEIRPNLPTKSAGNTTDTSLRAFASVDQALSTDLDMYLGGNITTLVPAAASTSVEKLWMRIRSGTQTVAAWDFLLYYTIY